ncbi:MAG: hypothetical protein COB59_08345 [Rhodospirillaceae bacterium]|nr:MAG: hypothetical protein COB59_08345 [Rhodospirillaceae bacterium]
MGPIKNKLKILVTGASGFIGHHIVDELVNCGFTVTTLSRNVDFHINGCAAVAGDLTLAEDAERVIAGMDGIVHCAGEKTDATLLKASNVITTQNLINAAKSHGLKRFVHISSVAVIGNSNARTIDETTPCDPMNAYGQTKYDSEMIVQGSNLSAVILRPTNVFGPETVDQWRSLSKVGGCLNGRENAHLVYVGDIAAAVAFALEMPENGVETFIVASDDEPGNTVGAIFTALTGNTVPFPAPLWLSYIIKRIVYGRVNWGNKVYSSERLKHAGYTPKYGLAEGLRLSNTATPKSD